MNQEYTEKQWEEEMRVGLFCGQHSPFGSCNLECPSCSEVGFYGPRKTENDKGEITRKYRACKWCGFWQDAWGDVFNERGGNTYLGSIMRHKNCGEGKTWGTAGKNTWCEKCGDYVIEEGAHKDDPNFQKIKEKMDRIHQNIPRISTH